MHLVRNRDFCPLYFTYVSVQVYLLGFILFSPNKSWYHQVEYGGQH